MKKKGFTLVELLAVIAILAILVIIALPNIMELFNEAKKNSFANEIKNIYNAAEQQYMIDAMYDPKDRVYARVKSENIQEGSQYTELKLSGRTNIEYAIIINQSGNISEFYATDGTYFIAYHSTNNYLKINDITTDNTKQFTISSDPIPVGANDNIAEIKEVKDQMCNNNTVGCSSANVHISYVTMSGKTHGALVFNVDDSL